MNNAHFQHARRLLGTLAALALAPAASADQTRHLDHQGEDTFSAEVQKLAPAFEPLFEAAALPADYAVLGQWSSVISWTPHIPVSAANLPDGRILTFASNQRTTFPSGVEFTYAATWNPATGQFLEFNNPSHDMFCAGIATLPDGRVLVNGGRNTVVLASIFDWRNNTWTRIQNMNDPRWYNTTVALPDSGVWTASGSGGSGTTERWNTGTGWSRLTGIDWNVVLADPGYINIWHPFVTLAPDGRLFHFGPTRNMHWITFNSPGTLSSSGTVVPGTHYPKEGCWVMYDQGRLLVAGGGANTTANPAGDNTTGTSATNAYTVNLNTTPPTITPTTSMTYARQFANCAVLPNGEVLVMGGNTSGLKFNDTGSILPCEIWNPQTGTWRTVGSMSVPRNYHSLALLLPDGRVMSGGGGLSGNSADHQDVQLYTPAALFNTNGSAATRPVLSTAPATIGAGAVFTVTGTPGLTKFAFIKMAAITHSVSTDLRRLVLPSVETTAGTYQLTAPSSLNVVTPGHWMLFGLLPSGVYSVAKVIQVETISSISLANPGNQADTVNLPTSLQLAATGPTGVTLSYAATGLPPGVTLNSANGFISGTPGTLGTYNVTATASGGGLSNSQSFTWTVSPATLTYSYPSFPNATGLKLNGSAALAAPALRLTTNLANQAGSAFLTSPIALGPNTSFSTRFVFRMHGTADGGDGLTFAIQGIGNSALGTSGGGLGVGSLANSLAVEFDTYQGTGDPNANHVGLIAGGDVTTHLQTAIPSFDLEDGSSHAAWVEYDGPARTLRVYLDSGTSNTRPAAPILTATGINLPALVGNNAWFGFTAGTGSVANNQDIEAWSLTVNAFALPLQPLVTNPGNQTTVLGGGVSLQIQATDGNGDLLSYSAANLPPGLAIGPLNGLISGTPTTIGSYAATVTASDGNTLPVTVSFTWTIKDVLNLLPLSGGPVQVGTTINFTGQSTGGLNPKYKWSFGDGSPDTALNASPSATHAYAAPGRYIVTLTARDDTGREINTSYHQAIHAPVIAGKPSASASIVFEHRTTGNDRVWCVNPDNDSVSVFDAVTRARLAEIAVGTAPRSLALAPDGRVWVVNAGAASLSLISPSTLTVVQTVSLPRASRPFGLAFDPDGTDAWVACEASGQLLRLNPTSAAIIGTLAVGRNARHVSVSADSSRVFVSRFVTPPLPGENTASVQTSVGGIPVGGEVVVVLGGPMTIERTVVLQHSEQPDTSISGSGIPNYLGAAVISPDGQSAWVASKQDNLKRGQLRNGQPLTHDNSLRSIASRIPLTAGTPAATDDLSGRVDFDNAGIPSAAAFDPKGVYLFVAIEGSREIAIVDVWAHREIARAQAGRAPQGIALSPDGRTLYVHNFMDRSITVHNVGPILDGSEIAPAIAATLNCVTADKLSPQVLLGKQLFYDAKDQRLALQQYISCAACHNDGAQDGRVWDFTQFGEGLRNTTTLRGKAGLGHGPLHWSGNFDEVQDFEGQIRNFAGGLGLMSDAVFHAGTRSQPLGDPKAGLSADLDALAAYLTSLAAYDPSPNRNSDGTLTTSASAGRAVFLAQSCARCHAGIVYTDSALNNLHDIGTLKPSSGGRLGGPLTGIDTPTLRSVWSTAPYLHDGSAQTIDAAVTAHQGVSLTPGDLANLVAFLQQLDGTEPAAELIGAVALTNPGPRQNAVGLAASLQLQGDGPFGTTLAYSASGLPPGLTLAAATGLISGTPTTAGTYAVIATVSGGGTSASQSFVWSTLQAVYTFDYSSFPNGSGLTLNGKAAIAAPFLRVVPATSGQIGSAFLTAPVPIGADSSFSSRAVFRMWGVANGGQGMTFIIQGNGPTALGTQKNGLGYQGITRSLAVELDTDKSPGDPNANHVAILSNGGKTHLATYNPTFDLEDGASHTLWVDYDGPSDTLRVYLDPAVTTQRPANPILTRSGLDLLALVGTNGWFGFSAAAGNPANNHDVAAWTLKVTSRPDLFPISGASVSGGAEALQAVTVRLLANADGPSLLEVKFRGVPGVLYDIQASSDPTSGVWQTMSSVTADDAGEFSIQEPCDQTTRFYRAVSGQQ